MSLYIVQDTPENFEHTFKSIKAAVDGIRQEPDIKPNEAFAIYKLVAIVTQGTPPLVIEKFD